MRNFGDADHAAPDHGDVPAILARQIEHQLNAVDRRLKHETTTRFSDRLKISSIRGRTARSDSVYPGRSALVESDISSRTPRLPYRRECAGRRVRCR